MVSRITRRRMAGRNHAVITVITKPRAKHPHRHEPCETCPWRKDAVGVFPATAFHHSAATAYDAAWTTFGCHLSKHTAPLTCAGFLLSEGALHNITVRIAQSIKGLDLDQIRSSVPLFANYREMAIANGVDPDDPALAPCRDRVSERRNR